jgi:hypothetical protein
MKMFWQIQAGKTTYIVTATSFVEAKSQLPAGVRIDAVTPLPGNVVIHDEEKTFIFLADQRGDDWCISCGQALKTIDERADHFNKGHVIETRFTHERA